MAARKQLWHPAETIKKIKTSQLINRLQDFALLDLSEEENIKKAMTDGQLRAAIALVNKTVPGMQPIDPESGKAGLKLIIDKAAFDL